jgi:hypothetical protein
MATLVTNVSRGPYPLPPVYGSVSIPPKDAVIIADTPANVKKVLGLPTMPVMVRCSQTLDNQPGAIIPSSSTPGTTGAAKVFEVDAPVAADVVTVSSAGLAANAASSAFVLAGNPDVQRNVQVAFGSGWDGGNVTIFGTRAGQNQTETIVASAGHTVVGVKAWDTVTSAAKGAVGSSSAVATIGVGNALGLPSQIANGKAVMMADNAAESATIDTVNNTFTPTGPNPPNGSVDYALIANS